MSDFFYMGGYAVYVWGSYALALLVLIINVWIPLRRERRLLGRIRRQNRREKA